LEGGPPVEELKECLRGENVACIVAIAGAGYASASAIYVDGPPWLFILESLAYLSLLRCVHDLSFVSRHIDIVWNYLSFYSCSLKKIIL